MNRSIPIWQRAPQQAPHGKPFPLLAREGRLGACRQSWAALSSWWQDPIDQPVVRRVEWIDESNSRQFKAILQVLGDQMTNAGPLCRGP
jgi:hypothetical protein